MALTTHPHPVPLWAFVACSKVILHLLYLYMFKGTNKQIAVFCSETGMFAAGKHIYYSQACVDVLPDTPAMFSPPKPELSYRCLLPPPPFNSSGGQVVFVHV
jgi:hypothetical protein